MNKKNNNKLIISNFLMSRFVHIAVEEANKRMKKVRGRTSKILQKGDYIMVQEVKIGLTRLTIEVK